jgi:adenosylcobinamide-phosphate synthase
VHGLINTLLSEHFLPFWVLLLVVLIEHYLPWPDKFHPISFIKILVKGMQAKVLFAERNSIRQQKMSGALAFNVSLLLFLVY